jgi:hypothetical protein
MGCGQEGEFMYNKRSWGTIMQDKTVDCSMGLKGIGICIHASKAITPK